MRTPIPKFLKPGSRVSRTRTRFNTAVGGFFLSHSHVIMTGGYLSANIVVLAKRVIENPYDLNDPEKIGGMVSVVGSTLNLYNNKVPLFFTICGATTATKAAAIAFFGHDNQAVVEHMMGMAVPFTVGMIMSTDVRFWRLSADAPIPKLLTEGSRLQKLTKSFNERRCAFMAVPLMIGRPAHFAAAVAQGDLGQAIYTSSDYIADWGLLFRDPKSHEEFQRYIDTVSPSNPENPNIIHLQH